MTVRVEQSAGVLVLTIDRAERRNALGTAIVEALAAELARADADPGIRAIVLTGTRPSFCAGSDLKELATMSVAEMVAHEAATGRMARSIADLATPVIAAVEGHALGGGFILAVSCDLVVSAADATWSLPEVKLGWLPPWGLKALTDRVGATAARRLTWGYETLDGDAAVRLGVVDYVAPAGEALDRALELAQRIAALPPGAVHSTKRYFARIAGDAEAWDADAGNTFALDCESSEARASLGRFRKP